MSNTAKSGFCEHCRHCNGYNKDYYAKRKIEQEFMDKKRAAAKVYYEKNKQNILEKNKTNKKENSQMTERQIAEITKAIIKQMQAKK